MGMAVAKCSEAEETCKVVCCPEINPCILQKERRCGQRGSGVNQKGSWLSAHLYVKHPNDFSQEINSPDLSLGFPQLRRQQLSVTQFRLLYVLCMPHVFYRGTQAVSHPSTDQAQTCIGTQEVNPFHLLQSLGTWEVSLYQVTL